MPTGTYAKIVEKVSTVWMSLAGIVASKKLLLVYLVARSAPFHLTTELARKFAPFTLRVKPALPAARLEGEIKVSRGVGLLAEDRGRGGGRPSTVRVTPPPGASAIAPRSALPHPLGRRSRIGENPFPSSERTCPQ